MTRRVRLQDLSHAQINALLAAFSGTPMKPTWRGCYVPGDKLLLNCRTFQAMMRLGLFSARGGGDAVARDCPRCR
jgi:hypothetical protein